MSPSSTQTLILHPQPHHSEQQEATLQPVLVSIYFAGSLPKHLAERHVPLRISVSVSDEFSSFTTPIIGQVIEDSDPSDFHTSSDDNSSADEVEIPIPFLPLSCHFDPTSKRDWSVLCSRIQHWLTSVPDTSQQWAWGCDIFWLSFIAAHPDFPFGRWPVWNSKITPCGPFIEGWLDGSMKQLILEGKEDIAAVQLWIWDEFSRQVYLFCPHLLTTVPSV